jgi:uncharacterized protein
MMKASRYNVTAAREDGGEVLFNTLYGSLTALAPEEVAEVTAALRNPAAAPPDVTRTLEAQQHLVPSDRDELAVVQARKQAGISSRRRLDVVVMTTMDCNLNCVYCYETHQNGTRMTPEVERRLCAWLEREVPMATLLMLHWFGGEPLYDTPLIARVSRRVQAIAASAGTGVALHVTTNGYLLHGWRRDELLAAGVYDFQVTMDGPADIHDRMRPTSAGRGSFEQIFRNVCDTVRADPRVGMTLRVNINHTNVERVSELLRLFEPDVRRRLRLALEPVFGDADVSATLNLTKQALAQGLADLYEEAKTLGYQVSAASSGLLTGRLTYCYAERERQHVINYDGSVYKCTAGSFDPADKLAELTEDGRIESSDGARESWMVLGERFDAACEECVYLPLCMGGCRKVRAQGSVESCTLVPSNASYVLKQVALSGFPSSLVESRCEASVVR